MVGRQFWYACSAERPPVSGRPAGSARAVAARMSREAAFTIIELMIVVAIVAVLAAIALPSYENYYIRTNRAAAKSTMLDVANRQQQYFFDKRQYAANIGTLAIAIPEEVSNFYTITTSAVNTATPPTFAVTATPIAGKRQAADGTLVYNSDGTRTPAEKWN